MNQVDTKILAGWVITIVDRDSVEAATGRVEEKAEKCGLEVVSIEVLSRPSAQGGSGYACNAIFVQDSGLEPAAEALSSGLRELADEIGVDLAIQSRSEYGVERRLFCFDMDSTLIQGEVIDELAKMAGVADRVVAITASAMRGEIEFQESFRRRVTLLAGLPYSRVRELLDRIPLMEGAERLFRTLKARGAKTAILSGGFTFFGEHLQEKLGVDYVYANVLDVDAEGYVTGQVREPIVDGACKAALLQQIAAEENIPLSQVVAVGDGANDLPMLGLAGMGVAFHAKPVVRAAARFSMTHTGLDSLLYLLGVPDWEWS